MVIALISAWGFANEPASQTNQVAGGLLHQSLKRFSLTAAFYGKTRSYGQIFFVGTAGLIFADSSPSLSGLRLAAAGSSL